MTETLILNTQEQKRVMVLNRLLVGQHTAVKAAMLPTLSERQVMSIEQFVHCSRDSPPTAISPHVRD
jgi:hypothetical protein